VSKSKKYHVSQAQSNKFVLFRCLVAYSTYSYPPATTQLAECSTSKRPVSWRSFVSWRCWSV